MNNCKVIALMVITLIASVCYGQEKELTLKDVKMQALEHHKTLQMATAHVAASQAAKRSADALNKPELSASVSGLYLSNPLNTLLPEMQTAGILSLSQVVYAGGKIENAKKLAQAGVELQMAQKEVTKAQVLLDVETAYWQLVSVQEKVTLAKEYLQLLDTLHTRLRNSFDAGLIYKNDLLKVEVQRNQAELQLVQAQDGLLMAKLHLAQMIGMDTINFEVQEEGYENERLLTEADQTASMEKRPEIAMLRQAVMIQEFQGKLLEGDRRPTLGLSAHGMLALGKQINFSDGSNDLQAFVGMVSLNIPILDWNGRKQKVQEQHYKTQAQQLELEESQELIQLEIQNAWLTLNQSFKRIELSQRSLQQAAENLRLSQDRLDAGTVVGADVLEAQVLWQQAFSEMIDAKVAYKIDQAGYQKAIGALE